MCMLLLMNEQDLKRSKDFPERPQDILPDMNKNNFKVHKIILKIKFFTKYYNRIFNGNFKELKVWNCHLKLHMK